jgi:menaquinone-dependent protoporphyrinogen oxidase
MPGVLIVYGTTHGHTEKIAARIGEAAESQGAGVLVRRVDEMDDSPAGYDAVIVGASIHAGHHQREVIDWVKRHRDELEGKPNAFFSVSLSAAEDTDESREANRKYIDDFTDETGWTPAESVIFAGALQYLEYDFMTRLLMRLLMRRDGHPTDTSQDYDYTDWEAVEEFGRRCAEMVKTRS